MEGAVLGGKLAAEVVAKKAKSIELPAEKQIQPNIVTAAQSYEAKEPLGVKGEGAIAFGGGACLTTESESFLRDADPVQFI